MRQGKWLSSDEIKQAICPTGFYSKELDQLKVNAGKKWINGGLCPFHADTSAGSFYINASTGSFKCYSCGAYGKDIIAFVVKKYSLSFREALEKLVEEWGI